MAKKDMTFKSLDTLKLVEKVINEASEALVDTKRVIVNSAIPEVLGAALGAGVGGALSFTALYTAGVVGLAATGITSGLAAAGAIVGGGMVAGVFVLAAPVAVLAVAGYGVFSHAKNNKLKQEKERLYQEALKKHDAILNLLKTEADASQDRIDYLNSLVNALTRAIRDLKSDLGEDGLAIA